MRFLRVLSGVGALALAVGAAAGAELDPGFGAAGEIMTPGEAQSGVVIDDAGRAVVSGWVFGGTATIRRLLEDGSPDPTFAAGGVFRQSFGWPATFTTGVALDPLGRIVIAGNTGGFDHRPYVARVLPNGAVDESFGVNGFVRVDALGLGFVIGIALDGAGRPVVLLTGEPVKLMRLTESGALDAEFGANGVVTTDMPFARGLDVAADGSVTVVGPSSGVAVRRYLPNGLTDSSFGNDGRASFTFPGPIQPGAIELTSDGGVLIGGSANRFDPTLVPPFIPHVFVARLDPSGELDSSFGDGGLVLSPTPGSAFLTALAVRPDGSVAGAGGWSDGQTIQERWIVLLDASGAPDARFGDAGVLRSGVSATRSLTLDRVGRLVAAGELSGTGGSIARFLLPALDDTPPVIEVADVEVDATSADGAIVAFVDDATDGDEPVPVSCTPPANSLFPIGVTVVTCTATDAAGNTGSASFVVHVRDADEQFAALRDDTALPTLHAKLDHATRPLTRTRTNCLALEYYAQAAKRRRLPELVERAQRIADVLAC